MPKLIVLSADALVTEDMDLLFKLPNMKRYMRDCATISKVRSVYPTITYPCHATMATGVYPGKHGVVRNDILAPAQKNRPWLWFYDALKWKHDIFCAAKEKGLSTAAVFWPCTGNHPAIDYLIAEYWTQGKGDSIPKAFARAGTTAPALDYVVKYAPLLKGHERKHPQTDDFTINCAREIIVGHKPDLLMIHVANIDGYRHQYGLFNENVDAAIYETDHYIGELFRACKVAGTLKDTNFVLTSDHGQMDISRIINLNVVFAREGLLRADGSGEITDWDAICVSGGMQACVYLKDPGDAALWNAVYDLLKKLRDDGIYGVGSVFTADEIGEKERVSESFSFAVDTDNYSAFGEDAAGPVAVTKFDAADYRKGQATHGYLPDKGPQPTLAAVGPGIKPGVHVEHGNLVDQAPTFAKLLGLTLPGIDGRAVDEILK